MKKYLILLCFCLIALLSNSCKKNSSDDTLAPVNSYMTFKVDGVGQSANKVAALLSSKHNNLSISGLLDNSGFVLLNIPSPQIGTYAIPQSVYGHETYDNLSIFYQADGTNANAFDGLNGSITITALTSTTVTGTFQISCSNPLGNPIVTKIISEGKFSSNFIIDTTN